MKRRASLLFGLGVLVSLSMSVPTYAATDNTQSIPQTQEAQQNEEGTEISSYKISEKTADGQWQLQDQNGNVVTGHNGFYIMGEYCYYAVSYTHLNLSLDFQKSFRLRIRQRFEPGTHTGGKDDGIVYMIRTERIIISVLKAVIELRLYHNERILL